MLKDLGIEASDQEVEQMFDAADVDVGGTYNMPQFVD